MSHLAHRVASENNYFGENGPWEGTIEAAGFYVHRMYHTNVQATTAQTIFGHYMMIDNPFIAE